MLKIMLKYLLTVNTNERERYGQTDVIIVSEKKMKKKISAKKKKKNI